MELIYKALYKFTFFFTFLHLREGEGCREEKERRGGGEE